MKETCPHCKIEKLHSDFAKHKNRKDGLQAFCKDCNKERSRIYYLRWTDEHRIEVKRRKKIYKTTAIKYTIDYLMEHPCIDCGETNPLVLEFDHKDPRKKDRCVSHFLTGNAGIALNRLKLEIVKCDVRCANCHRLKTVKQFNHEKYKIWKKLCKH